jgi:hypothetical protein
MRLCAGEGLRRRPARPGARRREAHRDSRWCSPQGVWFLSVVKSTRTDATQQPGVSLTRVLRFCLPVLILRLDDS